MAWESLWHVANGGDRTIVIGGETVGTIDTVLLHSEIEQLSMVGIVEGHMLSSEITENPLIGEIMIETQEGINDC